jgi:uncharacterized membrane protein SirB2
MSYSFYKILHFTCIFSIISLLSINLLAAKDTVPKWRRLLPMFLSLVLFVSGMGLIARLGLPHGEMFPGWVLVKMLIWMVIAVGGPVAIKRMNHNRGRALAIFIAFFIAAAIVATTKLQF